MSDGIPNYLPGMEPDNIRRLLDSFLSELDQAFPDNTIIWSEWDHERWDRPAGYLTKALGYQKGGDFLKAYGYEIISTKSDNSSRSISVQEKTKESTTKSVNRKKIPLSTIIVSFIAVVLAGAVVFLLIDRQKTSTKPSSPSSQSVSVSHEGTISETPDLIPEYKAEDHINDYDKYAILSFEEIEGSKENAYSDTYSVDFKVKNNSTWTLIHTSIKMCFYDEDGTIIETDNRSINFSFEGNQSVIVKFYCHSNYKNCKVVGYSYYFPRNNDILSGNSNVVDVDIISKNIRFMVSSLG